jgi:uncharacterized protein involved in cysteine biosynthesis
MVSTDMTDAHEPLDSIRLGSGFSGFITGIRSVFSGAGRLLRERELRVNALVPLLITLVAYLIAIGVFAIYVDDLMARLWLPPEDWKIYLWYALVPVVVVFFIVLLAMIFVTVATMISGPFYEKMVSHLLRGHEITPQSIGFLKGLYYEIVRALFFLVPAVGLAVLGIIPFVGAPFAVFGITIGWLGLASTSINPALMMTGHGTSSQIRFVFRSFWVLFGAGAVIGLSLTVPLLGLLVIPCSFVGLTDLYADALKTKPHP